MKPTKETMEILDWIATEISAGKALRAITPLEQTWNGAHDRSLAIIANYRQGQGLFQITRKARSATPLPSNPSETGAGAPKQKGEN